MEPQIKTPSLPCEKPGCGIPVAPLKHVKPAHILLVQYKYGLGSHELMMFGAMMVRWVR